MPYERSPSEATASTVPLHPLSDRYWGSFCVCALVSLALQLYTRSRDSRREKASADGETLILAAPNNNNDGNESIRGGGGSSSSDSSSSAKSAFTAFQRNYLAVYLLAVFADWLQGPYVYELYVYYGFDKGQISELFVCGFGSSMIVGTFVGGLADKLGRKNMCLLYSVCYVVACITKLVPVYSVLMLGRFLSGVSTSLLFSLIASGEFQKLIA